MTELSAEIRERETFRVERGKGHIGTVVQSGAQGHIIYMHINHQHIVDVGTYTYMYMLD